jgi:hypothetical protein
VKVGRVSRNGQVLDPLGTYVKKDSLPRAYSTVAFDGENWFVTWTDGHDFEYPEIYGTRVSQDGLILDTATIEVSAEPDYQMFPATAFDGTDYWAAWIDVRTGDTLVYAARVSPAGTVLDPDGIEAGGPVSTDWVWGVRPVVAEFDGTDCQLAWAQFGSIAGARLRPDGTVRDTFTTIRSSAACYPTLACGDEMLLTWTDWAGEVNGRTYNTARVWGKFGPFPGIKEGRGTPNAESRTLTATPNPSRGGVLIRCAGSFAGHVRVAISDASGRVVRRLATTDVEHGAQNVVWDGSDERGQRLPSGVYLIRVEGNGPSATYVVLIVR